MKYWPISLRALLVIFTFFLMPGAMAQTEVTMPPVGDYVLRFTTSDDTEKDYYSISSSSMTVADRTYSYVSANVSAGYIDNKVFYYIQISVFEEPFDLNDWVVFWNDVRSILARKFHETGYNEGLGRKTYFQYLSPTEVFKDGDFEDINHKKPTGMTYTAVFDSRVIIEFKTLHDFEAMSQEDIARFDEFAKTISVTFEDVFDTEEMTYAYGSPFLMLHLSPGNFTKASTELMVPKDWIVEETTLIEATPEQREGKIVLDLAPYEEPFPGEASEKLRISLVGLPEQKLKTATYQKEGKRALAEIIQSPQLLSSKDISDDMDEYAFGGHCLSNYKGSANSGGVMATTYEGLDSEGLPIKVLHFSSGGFYLACNYVYSAAPERFDENVDFVMDMLHGLVAEFLGPPIKR